MVYSKSPLTALLLVTLASLVITANQFTGCVEINNGKCIQCLQRKVLEEGQGCGPLLPKTDKCLFYIYNRFQSKQICAACKPGFADKISFSGSSVVHNCIKGSIPGCLLEVDIGITADKVATTCAACPQGKYSVLDKQTRTSTCKAVAKPAANCFWGGVFKDGKAQCIRCNDGFAVDSKTRLCVKSVGAGCWIQQAGKCIACNPFEGYSINAQGGCFKTPTLSGAESAGSEVVRDVLARLGLGGF